MGQISSKLRDGEDFLTYWCQGCEASHTVHIGSGYGPRWRWNGSADAPTFEPSVFIRTGHHVPGVKLMPDGRCGFCVSAEEDGHPTLCSVCHTFIRDGRVQFLPDCTHRYAGQTLPLPDLPEHMRDEPPQ